MVAIASSPPATTAPTRTHLSSAHAGGDAARAADDALPRATDARRRRRRSKKKKEEFAKDEDMAVFARQSGEVLPQPAPPPLDPIASVSCRPLGVS